MRSLSSPHLSAEDRIPLLPSDSLMTNCCLHALDAPSRRDESRDACQMSRVIVYKEAPASGRGFFVGCASSCGTPSVQQRSG